MQVTSDDEIRRELHMSDRQHLIDERRILADEDAEVLCSPARAHAPAPAPGGGRGRNDIAAESLQQNFAVMEKAHASRVPHKGVS